MTSYHLCLFLFFRSSLPCLHFSDIPLPADFSRSAYWYSAPVLPGSSGSLHCFLLCSSGLLHCFLLTLLCLLPGGPYTVTRSDPVLRSSSSALPGRSTAFLSSHPFPSRHFPAGPAISSTPSCLPAGKDPENHSESVVDSAEPDRSSPAYAPHS